MCNPIHTDYCVFMNGKIAMPGTPCGINRVSIYIKPILTLTLTLLFSGVIKRIAWKGVSGQIQLMVAGVSGVIGESVPELVGAA